MKQKIRIYPHIHDRDGKQAYKETTAHVFELVKEKGVRVCIVVMPNTDPPIITEDAMFEKLKLVPVEQKDNYFLWFGLTANEDQIKEAVRIYNEPFNKQVVGFKLYAGKSTGDLAVIKKKDQEMIFAVLASLEYKGPVAVHCEKEAFIDETLFNPFKPYTHSLARPKIAEIASIQDIIGIVEKTNFKGALHICHVSCPESVDLVVAAKKEISITCEVTPDYILWHSEMPIMKRLEGLGFKMNPPLRSKEDMLSLREYLKAGKIDWLATDHAPHAYGEKFKPPYPSGCPSLYDYRNFVKIFLPSLGLSEDLIRKMTCDNILKTLNLEL